MVDKRDELRILEDGGTLRAEVKADRAAFLVRRVKWGAVAIPILALLVFEDPFLPAVLALSLAMLLMAVTVRLQWAVEVALSDNELVVRGSAGTERFDLTKFVGAATRRRPSLMMSPGLVLEGVNGRLTEVIGARGESALALLADHLNARIAEGERTPGPEGPTVHRTADELTIKVATRPRFPDGYAQVFASYLMVLALHKVSYMFAFIALGAALPVFVAVDYFMRPWGAFALRVGPEGMEYRGPRKHLKVDEVPPGLALRGDARFPSLCSHDGVLIRQAFSYVSPFRRAQLEAAIADYVSDRSSVN